MVKNNLPLGCTNNSIGLVKGIFTGSLATASDTTASAGVCRGRLGFGIWAFTGDVFTGLARFELFTLKESSGSGSSNTDISEASLLLSKKSDSESESTKFGSAISSSELIKYCHNSPCVKGTLIWYVFLHCQGRGYCPSWNRPVTILHQYITYRTGRHALNYSTGPLSG